MKKFSVAIVGATGAVGLELIRLLALRAFPVSRVQLLASARSAGTELMVDGVAERVQALESFDFDGVDIVFFSAGDPISREYGPKAAQAGALVIDNSNAFRMEPSVPLVVPQVNAAALPREPFGKIIANPNCSTIQLVRALQPVMRVHPVNRIVVSTYQAASGGGLAGMQELADDSANVLAQRTDKQTSENFPMPLAFNAIPLVGSFLDAGECVEERKIRNETRKILGMEALQVSSVTVRIPVVNGHSEAVWVECTESVDIDRVFRELQAEAELRLYRLSDPLPYPTPRFLGDPALVHVGRVRIDPENERALWMWVVADNLWVGAALNAVQIAEQALLAVGERVSHAL